MRLNKLAEARATTQNLNHSILLYGPSKSGKTQLAATAAKIKEIDRVFWLDGENGIDTILNMGLTNEELAKFHIYKIPDTRDNPRFIETTMKMLTAKQEVLVCNKHGRVNCPECKSLDAEHHEPFLLSSCTSRDLVIIDSGSQLGASALNFSCKGQPVDYKPTFDDYGYMGKVLSDCLLVVQQCQYTNFVVITHELLHEAEDGSEKIFPLMGTKSFSTNVPKYFGTVIHTKVKTGKHIAGSSSTYSSKLVTGSRLNIKTETEKEPSMEFILREGGIIA